MHVCGWAIQSRNQDAHLISYIALFLNYSDIILILRSLSCGVDRFSSSFVHYAYLMISLKGVVCWRTLHLGLGYENLAGNSCLHTDLKKARSEGSRAVNTRVVSENKFTVYHFPFPQAFLVHHFLKTKLDRVIEAIQRTTACWLVRHSMQLVNAINRP